MIVDWSETPNAQDYDVLDAATGEPHPNMDVFYADDDAGLFRYYLRDASGRFYFEEPGRERLAFAEVRQPIKIVRKSG